MVQGFHAGKGVASALVLSLVLVACGGGGSDDSAPAATTPSSSAPASSAPSSSAPSSSTSSSSEASSSESSSSSAPATQTTWLPTFTALSALLATNATDPAPGGNVNFAAISPTAVSGIEIYSKSAGGLRLYKNDAGDAYWIQYNGANLVLGAVGTQVAADTADRYLAVPSVTSGSTVTVKYTYGSSSTCQNCTNASVALTDAAGTILATQVIPALSGEQTISATATSTGKMYVLFGRNGDGGGSLRVWSVTK